MSEQVADDADSQNPKTKNRKQLTGSRLVAVIAGVATVSLLLGVALMQFVVSPAELAARTAAPDAGPITAPIEQRVISNTIIARGEIGYADTLAVSVDAAGSESRPVITGHVPAVGAVLEPGSVVLEVAGRPVIALPGDLPVYRTMRPGMSGPDVLQLKHALNSLGYAVGDTASDYFDYNLSAALRRFYQQLGYPVNDGGSEGRRAVRTAEKALQALIDAPAEEQDAEAINDARVDLHTAQEAALPFLPSSEVVFLKGLPLRVDEVTAQRGKVLEGSPFKVSGADLTVTSAVSKKDAELLKPEMLANFTLNGKKYTAKITKIVAPNQNTQDSGDSNSSAGSNSGSASRNKENSQYLLELTPENISAEDFELLRGNNVKLQIPVASTAGEVLAVPIAALQASSNGESRVELLVSEKADATAKTELVTVETGLAADGLVEIKSTDARIVQGAKVVVGR